MVRFSHNRDHGSKNHLIDAVTSVAVTDCQVKEGGFRGGFKVLQQANPSLNHHQSKFKLPKTLVVLILGLMH